MNESIKEKMNINIAIDTESTERMKKLNIAEKIISLIALLVGSLITLQSSWTESPEFTYSGTIITIVALIFLALSLYKDETKIFD
ncbi:MAG: hypothetical protein ACP6IS_11660 [Candidatus Asgardarchaeia archaeon]